MEIQSINKNEAGLFVVTSVGFLGPDKFKRTTIDEISLERLKQIESELLHQEEAGKQTMGLIERNLRVVRDAMVDSALKVSP